jgi:hypothetical protein
MMNLREKRRRKRPEHPDFEWMMSASHPTRSIFNSPERRKRYRSYLLKLDEFGPSFGVLRWGDIGRIEKVRKDTSAHIYWIRDISEHGKVREIIESIDFQNDVLQYWMGAPSVLIEDLVEIYDRKREVWKAQKKL